MKHKCNEKCNFNWKKFKIMCTGALLLGMFSGSSDICIAGTTKVTVTKNAVSMYSWASTGSTRLRDINGEWFLLEEGQEAEYIWETDASDGTRWCKISFVDEDGMCQSGYVPKNSIEIEQSEEYKKDKEFEKYLTKQGFPESYKDALRSLHAKYPDWVFQAKKVNTTWEKAVKAQSSIGKNTVPALSYESFKSKEKGSYDEQTDTFITFGDEGKISADSDLIAYYMDPRNFLTEDMIFQFYSLSDVNKNQTKKAVKQLLAGSFMEENKADGKTEYAKLLIDAAKKANVNPYYLAFRIMCLTQGEKNDAVSGEFGRFSGIYNFYGLGTNNLMDYTSMITYATAADKSTQRPWNTEKKAITGGAVALAQEYIAGKQNTLYSQKFDIAGTLFVHQNSDELYSAAKEAKKLAQFLGDKKEEPLVFEIPYYEKMPDETVMQVNDKSDNNLLADLTVAGQSMSPAFDSNITDYYVIADDNTTRLQIDAHTVNDGAKIEGTGMISLEEKSSTYQIKVTAENGDKKTYRLHVAKLPDATTYAYKVSKTITLQSSQYPIHAKGYMYRIPAGTTAQELLDSIQVEKGSAKILNAKGKKLDGVLATGCICRIVNEKGKKVKDISLCVQGDLNGDGVVDVLDMLSASRHMQNIAKLKGIYQVASDVDLGEDKLTQNDVEALSRLIMVSMASSQGE